jgi:Tfp pilus assembly protein PilO
MNIDFDLIKIFFTNMVSFLISIGAFSYYFNNKLENLKSKIAKENSKYSIQQKIIIEKNIELYDKLKPILNELDFLLKRVCLNIKSDSTFLEESKEAYINKFLEFNHLLYENEILLKEDILIDIKKDYESFFKIFNEDVENQIKEKLPNTMEEISQFTGEQRKKIIEIFRIQLGIE